VTVNATTAGYQTNEVSVGEFGGYASDTVVLSVSLPQATFYVQTIWTPVVVPPAAADATQTVTVEATGTAQFFQLRMQ
jgi:hypothetical protein